MSSQWERGRGGVKNYQFYVLKRRLRGQKDQKLLILWGHCLWTAPRGMQQTLFKIYKKMENKANFFWLFFHTLEPIHNTKMTPIKMRPHLILKYRACAFITRSWFETALDYKPRFLGSKIEEYPCLVHKLSVILTALYYKRLWKTE